MNFHNAVKKYRELSENLNCNFNDDLRIESFVESIKDWSELDNLDTIEAWFKEQQEICSMTIKDIPLDDCKDWFFNNKNGYIEHKSGDFFFIQGLRVENSKEREVDSGWDQPIITQVGLKGGLLGLLRKKINSIPYYLVEAKAEPGNPDRVQISPTLQATFANINQAHQGKKPKFVEFFESPRQVGGIIRFEQWMSEDGGRLHLKKNKGMIVEVDEEYEIPSIAKNFKWMTLYQIKYFIKKNSWVGPHIRSIISHL